MRYTTNRASVRAYCARNTESVASLLMAFFEYYTKRFDFCQEVGRSCVCVSGGGGRDVVLLVLPVAVALLLLLPALLPRQSAGADANGV